ISAVIGVFGADGAGVAEANLLTADIAPTANPSRHETVRTYAEKRVLGNACTISPKHTDYRRDSAPPNRVSQQERSVRLA
ncbi:MAG: hypothetical protein AAF125_28155, partial [Chloroflexota bacterium]